MQPNSKETENERVRAIKNLGAIGYRAGGRNYGSRKQGKLVSVRSAKLSYSEHGLAYMPWNYTGDYLGTPLVRYSLGTDRSPP